MTYQEVQQVWSEGGAWRVWRGDVHKIHLRWNVFSWSRSGVWDHSYLRSESHEIEGGTWANPTIGSWLVQYSIVVLMWTGNSIQVRPREDPGRNSVPIEKE